MIRNLALSVFVISLAGCANIGQKNQQAAGSFKSFNKESLVKGKADIKNSKLLITLSGLVENETYPALLYTSTCNNIDTGKPYQLSDQDKSEIKVELVSNDLGLAKADVLLVQPVKIKEALSVLINDSSGNNLTCANLIWKKKKKKKKSSSSYY